MLQVASLHPKQKNRTCFAVTEQRQDIKPDAVCSGTAFRDAACIHRNNDRKAKRSHIKSL